MRKATKKKVTRKKVARRVTRKTTKKVAVRKGAKAWSAAEVARLRQMYKTMPASKIAKALRRSESSVKSKARALRLRKPAVRRAAKKKVATKRKAAPKRRTATKRKAAPKRRKAAKKKVARKKVAKKKVARKKKR
jgi:adenylate kinase